jgi:peptide chain release factor subunit 1
MSRINRVPANGICLYCGLTTNSLNQEKKVVIDFEPPRPISCSAYVCDRGFYVDPIRDMIAPREKFGYVVIGGQRCVIGLVAGEVQRVLEAFSVDLPKKHGMGGQSATRFQRLTDEARHNLVRRVSESARKHFIANGNPCVTGIVLAGCAQLKNQLKSSELLGDKLNPLVLQVVDVAYDGEQGFREAVKRSRAALAGVASVREQQALERLFDVAGKGGNCAFGIGETMNAWELRAIAVVYVSRDLDTVRVEFGDHSVAYCKPDETVAGAIDQTPLVEWIVDHYREIGCEIELVGTQSPEGAQFYKGLGGLGALLRFPVSYEAPKTENDDDFDEDFDF